MVWHLVIIRHTTGYCSRIRFIVKDRVPIPVSSLHKYAIILVMTNEPVKKITVPESSTLTKLLADAALRPLLLEKNGEVFRLERMENTEKTPSPEDVTRSREGIRNAAGSWKGIDTEAFKAYIKDRRQTATHTLR
jgi:hypothetical protein